MSDEAKLWAILIPGPDDVWAMASKAAAEDTAEKHNAIIKREGLPEQFGMRYEAFAATVIEWPHGKEAHAEALLEDAQ